MLILKSQLGNKKLESIIEDERVEYCTFENEEYWPQALCWTARTAA